MALTGVGCFILTGVMDLEAEEATGVLQAPIKTGDEGKVNVGVIVQRVSFSGIIGQLHSLIKPTVRRLIARTTNG